MWVSKIDGRKGKRMMVQTLRTNYEQYLPLLKKFNYPNTYSVKGIENVRVEKLLSKKILRIVNNQKSKNICEVYDFFQGDFFERLCLEENLGR